jgi:hypothetical protein
MINRILPGKFLASCEPNKIKGRLKGAQFLRKTHPNLKLNRYGYIQKAGIRITGMDNDPLLPKTGYVERIKLRSL